ncbi:MAG TPA: dihydrofolate reductase family protein [Gemmatimonadaceae bacterium]
MRPHVTCLMFTSVDGRVQTKRWVPKFDAAAAYERMHNALEADAWLVGRTTGEEFNERDEPYPPYSGPPIPREDWFAVESAETWAVVMDANGKIAWGTSDVGGDRIVVLLSRQVSDNHLAGLRADGVSYIFGGDTDIDLRSALETLGHRLGIKRLLMEGGGHANGAMLAAGLIDELHLVVAPHVDGSRTSPSLFDVEGADEQRPPVRAMTLESHELLDGGLMLLRYKLENG